MSLVLAGLQQLSVDVTTARKGLDDLNDQITAMGTLLSSVTRRALAIQSELERMAGDMAIFKVTKNDDYLVNGEDLQEQTDNAAMLRRELHELRQHLSIEAWNAVRSLRRWSPLAQPKMDIDLELRNAAATLAKKVKDASIQQTPWAYYREQVRGACDELFAQYVDLVGGIALRDQGLDRSVSSHADVLVALLLESFGGRGALAVPSRHAPEALIQAQHVRIPLPPGWTLWSLPLVARGVGELLLRDLNGLASPHLLPDVFGTFVMGPAYAFAAILFELDPSVDHDQQRAGVILDTMRCIDEHDDNRRFSGLAGEIQAEWASASAALNAKMPGTTAVGEDGFEDLFDRVRTRCENAAYLAEDRWDVVEELSENLGDKLSGTVNAGAELRDVLNAMWLARWRNPYALDAIYDRATAAARPVTATGGDQSQDRPAETGRSRNQR